MTEIFGALIWNLGTGHSSGRKPIRANIKYSTNGKTVPTVNCQTCNPIYWFIRYK